MDRRQDSSNTIWMEREKRTSDITQCVTLSTRIISAGIGKARTEATTFAPPPILLAYQTAGT